MRRIAAVLAAAATVTAGCAGHARHATTPAVAASRPAAVPSVSAKGKPVPAAPRCPQPMGAAVDVRDRANGGALRLAVSHPTWSSTSLSPDYGSAPSNGWYLTVRVRLVATGDQPISIGPSDFYATAPGRPKTTTDDGNADESGASEALGATVADPGETVTGPLTFDLAERHGTVVYAPGAKPVCSWRF